MSELTDAEKAEVADRIVRELRTEMAAEAVLASHYLLHGGPRDICGGCGWSGLRHVAHLASVLADAGLLADGPPPVTLTERILAERADRSDK